MAPLTRNMAARGFTNDDSVEELFGLIKNPLRIDLILSEVFSLCDKDTLKSCRLVSHQWKRVASLEWEKKVDCLVVVPNDHKARKLVKTIGDVIKHISWCKRVYCYSSIPDKYPSLKNVEMMDLRFNRGLEKMTRKFWNLCGPWMKELWLTDCIIQKKQVFYDIVSSKFTPALEKVRVTNIKFSCNLKDPVEKRKMSAWVNPNLTEFKIDRLTVTDIDSSHVIPATSRFPIDWSYILSNYPNLKQLRLDICYGVKRPELLHENLLLSMVKIREADGLNLLESFCVVALRGELEPEPNIMELYQRAKLPHH